MNAHMRVLRRSRVQQDMPSFVEALRSCAHVFDFVRSWSKLLGPRLRKREKVLKTLDDREIARKFLQSSLAAWSGVEYKATPLARDPVV